MDLKIGDKVIVSPHWSDDRIDVVKKVTKTQIILDRSTVSPASASSFSTAEATFFKGTSGI